MERGAQDPAEGSGSWWVSGGAAVLVGLLAGVALALVMVPALMHSLSGAQPKAYWYLSRASGLVAYTLLWASVAMGLLITSKTSRVWPGGPVAVDAHQFLSLVALGFAFFHGLVLRGDSYSQFSVLQLAVPFATGQYRPLWVGIGQLGFYLAGLITLSFYVRKRIGPKTWRLLHYGSFVVYSMVLLHALMSGTDRAAIPVQALYWTTGAATYFLTVYRVLVSMKGPRPARDAEANVGARRHQGIAGRG